MTTLQIIFLVAFSFSLGILFLIGPYIRQGKEINKLLQEVYTMSGSLCKARKLISTLTDRCDSQKRTIESFSRLRKLDFKAKNLRLVPKAKKK